MSGGIESIKRPLRTISLIFVVAASVLFAACGAEEGSSGSSGGSKEPKNGKTEAASKPSEKTSESAGGKSVEKDSGDKSKNASASANKKKKNSSGGAASNQGGAGPMVEIEFGGEKGTRFSSTCFIGQERTKTKGEVPDVLSMKTGGRKVECEILKKGQGALETTLVAGESRHEQRTDSRWATISLTYSKAGFFSSVKTSSAGSAAASSQTSVTSKQSSSSSSATSD
ncbi:MAG: hypothetical protein ACR2G1_04765 [Rubrobacteraceae bacterium]